MSFSRQTVRPFAGARAGLDTLLGEVIANTSYDPEFAAAMAKRDDVLIEQEVLHGALSQKFIYNFTGAGGARFTGISVVGARELAYHYGGIHHSLLGSTTKRGSMFIFENFETGMPEAKSIPQLADERDFVSVRIRLVDAKKDNRIEVIHTEMLKEARSDRWIAEHPGADAMFDRPHAQTIALSKAYRNGVRTLVPQHVQIEWLKKNVEVSEDLTTDVLGEKRSAVQRYAASKGLTLDRRRVEDLTLEQISGLSDAAREGDQLAFATSCQALGLLGAPEGHRPREVTGGRSASPRASTGQQEKVVDKIDTNPGQEDEKMRLGTKPDAPEFIALLHDENGMQISVENEKGETVLAEITNPVDLANWLAGQIPASRDPVALWENNLEVVAIASDLDPAAGKILDDCKTAVEQIAEQRAKMHAAEAARKREGIERAAKLEAAEKAALAERAAPQDSTPAVDERRAKDLATANGWVGDIEACAATGNKDGLLEFQTGKAFLTFADRMRRDYPDIYRILDVALTTASQKLGIEPPAKKE